MIARRRLRGALGIRCLLADLQHGGDQLLAGLFELGALLHAQSQLRLDDVLVQARQFGTPLPGRLMELGDVRSEIG